MCDHTESLFLLPVYYLLFVHIRYILWFVFLPSIHPGLYDWFLTKKWIQERWTIHKVKPKTSSPCHGVHLLPKEGINALHRTLRLSLQHWKQNTCSSVLEDVGGVFFFPPFLFYRQHSCETLTSVLGSGSWPTWYTPIGCFPFINCSGKRQNASQIKRENIMWC